ncbi:LysR substrate-binding domain-containing protein [Pararhodospirillum photometricum]|uniref:Transcriptional regulator, LysR family n=1 Tax=Pararhodospirillum photometricum DSM 122 TaxID=1150469 RepID=H6SPX2_PARPM|nr:LysR substrate-binding domain-containing protein [Pararhodospirillum photometricum]CCG07242.1 Transcriptional regulator, LysR family [Pararhodospirillum photometricum DSM 122]
MDLVDLRVFVRVVDQGSITRGAQDVGLSLPAASARIRALEAEAGVVLLERQRRGVVPTPAGLTLLRHARVILRQMRDLHDALDDEARRLSGAVRLVANTAALAEALPERLAAFLRASPSLTLDLEERPSVEGARDVREGRADLAIIADSADTEGLTTALFHLDRLMLAVPSGHPLAARAQVAFAEALDNPFLGLGAERALQRHLSAQARRLGHPLHLRARLPSLEGVCRLVAGQAGVAVVPNPAHPLALPVVLVPLSDPWATRRLLLASGPLEHLSRPAQTLRHFLLT